MEVLKGKITVTTRGKQVYKGYCNGKEYGGCIYVDTNKVYIDEIYKIAYIQQQYIKGNSISISPANPRRITVNGHLIRDAVIIKLENTTYITSTREEEIEPNWDDVEYYKGDLFRENLVN